MTGAESPRPIIIFRDRLLPGTETFIPAQAEALSGFVPYYLGSKRLHGIPLPVQRLRVVNQGPFGLALEFLFKRFGYAPRLLRRAQALKPALIHAHFGPDGALALPLARLLAVPLIVTYHGYDATVHDAFARRSFYVHRLYARRKSDLKREATLFLTASEFIRERLLAQEFPAARTIVHYTGIDTQWFRRGANVPRDPVVLFVGRLVEKKGCAHLIRAMAAVKAQEPEAEAIIIGDGELRRSLEDLARELRAPCRFVGHQAPEAVRSWMNRASVLCAPSIIAENGDAEGFGMAIAEAQAMELPVVGFASGGIPEVVMDGIGGFLAPEGDWMQLAERISRVLRDPELGASLGAAGRARMIADFDLSRQTQRLERIYHQVIQGEQPGCRD